MTPFKLKSVLILLLLSVGAHPSVAKSTEVYAHFLYKGKMYYGRIEKGEIRMLNKAPWEGGVVTEKMLAIDQVKLQHPSEPGVIIGLAKSYSIAWKGKKPPQTVRWFIKPPGAAASPGDTIFLPPTLNQVKVEAELMIVIGKKVKNATLQEAQQAIFGYTIGIDVVGTVASYLQRTGDNPNRVEKVLPIGLKDGDRFQPFGPFIYRGIKNLKRKAWLKIENSTTGKHVYYSFSLSGLLYSPGKIVRDLSRVFTLHPGDIISTGTPKAFLAGNGDVVTAGIEGFGKLQNKIVVP